MQRYLVPALGVVGVVMLLLGLCWKTISPTSLYWSDDRANEYTKAFAELHAAEDSAIKHPGIDSQHQFADARDRFGKIKSELDEARSQRDRTGPYLVAAGIFAILGAVVARWTMDRLE
jgi:hypothetical protein